MSLGATGRQLLSQGPAPAGPPDDRPGAQPDDHAGPLDGRDHGAHRRAGPRRGHPARAVQQIDVGAAFDAGLAIVILAIVLDRLTERASERLDPRQRALRSASATAAPRDRRGAIALVGGGASSSAWSSPASPTTFPDAIAFSFRAPVNAVVDWLRSDVAWLTERHQGRRHASGSSTRSRPCSRQSPWWLVDRRRSSGIALLVSAACVRRWSPRSASLLIVALGLWEHAMETLVQVLVATAMTLRDRARAWDRWPPAATGSRRALRPFLDAAQTMPAFVYLIPAVALFDPSRFTAIVAALIFARAAGHPPRRGRHPDGARRRSSRRRRRRARPRASCLEGPAAGRRGRPSSSPPTRAIILVLAMVVVGGLVGGRRARLRRRRRVLPAAAFGEGLAAGIAIVLLGIMLDRITQGADARPTPRQASTRGWRFRSRPGWLIIHATAGSSRPVRRRTTDRMRVITRVPRARRRRPPSGFARAPRAAAAGSVATERGAVDIAVNPWVGSEANARRHRAPAREPARLHGRVQGPRRRRSPGRASRRARSTPSSRTGATPTSRRPTSPTRRSRSMPAARASTGSSAGTSRRWMAERVPGHHRLEQPQQVRRPVQDVRVRRQGPVPRRRPVVRHQ